MDPYKIEQQIDVKLARAKEPTKLGPKVRWLQVRVIKQIVNLALMYLRSYYGMMNGD